MPRYLKLKLLEFRLISYITAAYGSFYRDVALKGLIYSFYKYNPLSTLTVYVDEYPEWSAPKNCYFFLIPHHIYNSILTGDGSFFSRTSFKFSLMLETHKKTKSGICWIDSDSLVLTNLDREIDASKISVIAHGSCDDDEKFDCGGGLNVRGSYFAIGGLFYIPSKKDIEFLIEMVEERSRWADDKDAYWFSDGEQSLINHLVESESSKTDWLGSDGASIFNWSFLEFRHPVPFDSGLASIEAREEGFFVGEKKLAVLMWTSLMLRRHSKQGFRSFSPGTAKKFRNDFYSCKNSGLRSYLLQIAYFAYDYFDLDKLRKIPK